MGTNTTSGTNARGGKENMKEVSVDRNAEEAEVQALRNAREYEDAVIGCVVWETTKDQIIEKSGDPDSNSGNTGNKISQCIKVSSTLIMKFKEKIQDIINGVTLKLKGKDKDKSKKTTRDKRRENEENAKKEKGHEQGE